MVRLNLGSERSWNPPTGAGLIRWERLSESVRDSFYDRGRGRRGIDPVFLRNEFSYGNRSCHWRSLFERSCIYRTDWWCSRGSDRAAVAQTQRGTSAFLVGGKSGTEKRDAECRGPSRCWGGGTAFSGQSGVSGSRCSTGCKDQASTFSSSSLERRQTVIDQVPGVAVSAFRDDAAPAGDPSFFS